MEIAIVALIFAAALAAVIIPAARARARAAGPDDQPHEPEDAALDAEVARYRESLRAGTHCGRCHTANPPGSRFCAECGRPLSAVNSPT